MSVEYASAIEELAQVLANRFARLARGWEASTPGKRQDDLEKILAARNVAAKLPDLITESDALALLNLEDPLQAVAEQWLKMTGLDRPQDDALRQCVGTLCGSALRQDALQTAKTQKAHRRDTMAR
ncbi:hypothetical protein N510_001165 [Firmicutes bacterium ASF500]|nr:hypothetical protein N510_001165 [Firmicutes bacterium ASF500]